MGKVEVHNKDTGEVTERRTPFLDEHGREIVDGTPMAPPVGWHKTPSMFETIRDMVRSEQLRMAAEGSGMESFEEADDFDVGDDFDPRSPYEETFDYTPTAELRARAARDSAPSDAPSPAANAPTTPPPDGPGPVPATPPEA